MQKESITRRQANCILITFIFGSTVVFGVGTEAGQDMWISLLITIATIVPVSLIYARTIKLCPGKNLSEMLEELFGKVFGKILIILYVWYSIHLSASILRNFTDFIQVTSMPETPQVPVAICILAVILYLTKCGLEVFGKWAVVVFIVVCGIIPFTVLLSSNTLDWTHLSPIMNHDLKDILTSSFQQFSLPFGETVLFLGIAASLGKNESPYKVYLYGILCAGFISVIILMRNILVLGPEMMESVYYPSFVAGRIINPGEFFARIESVISMNYLLAGVTKIALCVFVAAKASANLFNLQNYKSMLAPVCFLCLMFSMISYHSSTHLFVFVKYYYPVYVVPFQIMIPLLVWITAEFKNAKKKNHNRFRRNE